LLQQNFCMLVMTKLLLQQTPVCCDKYLS